MADFTAYSSKFTPTYVTHFGTLIKDVFEVVEPQSEIQQQKKITERITETLNGLIDPANRLMGYIKFSHSGNVDFGLAQLRKEIKNTDAEGAIKSLHTLSSNITNFKAALVNEGLTDELIARFINAGTNLTEDKRKQYEIFSGRKSIVQNNVGLFNELYDQLTDILTAGKILYKATDPAKLQEYTFEDLKKRVRRESKPVKPENKDQGEAPAPPDKK